MTNHTPTDRAGQVDATGITCRLRYPTSPWKTFSALVRNQANNGKKKVAIHFGQEVSLELSHGQAIILANAIADALDES